MKKFSIWMVSFLTIVFIFSGCEKKPEVVVKPDTPPPDTLNVSNIFFSSYSDDYSVFAPIMLNYYDLGRHYNIAAYHDEFILVLNSWEEFNHVISIQQSFYSDLYEQCRNIDFENQSVIALWKTTPYFVTSIESETLIINDDQSMTLNFTFSGYQDTIKGSISYFAVVSKIDENQKISLEINWNFDYTEIPVFNVLHNRGDLDDETKIYFTINENPNCGVRDEQLVVINSMEQLQEKVTFGDREVPAMFYEVDFSTQSILGIKDAHPYSWIWEVERAILIEKSGKKALYLVFSYYEAWWGETTCDYLVIIPKTESYSLCVPDMFYNNPPITVRTFDGTRLTE